MLALRAQRRGAPAQGRHAGNASRVEPERAEKLADRILVHRWITTDRKLLYRVLSVFSNGELRREDAIIGEALPIS